MQDRLNKDFFLMNSGFSNYENTTELPRHRWYYYKEGFSPNLVEEAILKSDLKSTDLIIDPFNGSGTTTLTASLLGHQSLGVEVNPFTAFLSSAKTMNIEICELDKGKNRLFKAVEDGSVSPLLGYSTFSKKETLNKWLFNDQVLNAFEGGWQETSGINSVDTKMLLRLALISSAMQNCNGRRDGKCLRYRQNWESNGYNKESFLNSLAAKISMIKDDLESKPLQVKSKIVNGDARNFFGSKEAPQKFKLCITSPPYLNTFDYTDIYRPELFLGKFISNSQQLYDLRLKTVRSHIQARWQNPVLSNFGLIYDQAFKHITEHKNELMHKNIPLMVQAYFEDMYNILLNLKSRADSNAQIWLVVSNSAYANIEIPVDLIIGDIGTKAGWFLKEIGVLRNIKRRKTKHSPDILTLRESVIIFSNSKK